ncbi:type II toxin-antitoxin system VapC family toxin [Clostridium baratii]|uniref:type II toxin-antitoxin system VapC family toxin n=1 Tax=Clostridium baratii TaxID=1561 RepID=UPI0022E7B73F|nr:type II toxin-antitoxin system VapC family toxin [Clostridium baratii]
MSKKIDLDSFIPKKDDKIFIDTNIWLYLFCPIGDYKKDIVNRYNDIFLKILKSKCAIYVTSLTLSEFFNTYSRIEFEYKKKQTGQKNLKYKREFRNTTDFNVMVEEIIEIINNKILKYSTRINDEFNRIDLNNILISDDSFDFNDKYFAELCEANNIKVLTNDKDFLKISNKIEVITS